MTAFVQRAVGTGVFATSATVTITPTAGNALVLIVYRDNNNSGPDVTSVTDTRSQAWNISSSVRTTTPPVADYSAADTTVARFSTAYVFDIGAGVRTITATLASADWLMLEVYEISGVNIVQGGNTAHPAAGTSASTTLTTTGTTFLLAMGEVRASDVGTVTAGWTQSAVLDIDSGVAYGRSAYQANAAAGSQSITWTWTGTKNQASGIMAFEDVSLPRIMGRT